MFKKFVILVLLISLVNVFGVAFINKKEISELSIVEITEDFKNNIASLNRDVAQYVPYKPNTNEVMVVDYGRFNEVFVIDNIFSPGVKNFIYIFTFIKFKINISINHIKTYAIIL